MIKNGKREVGKVKEFFSKYGYALMLAVGVIIFATTLTIATISSSKTKVEKGVEETGASSIIFTAPVLDATVYKDYNGSELIYNSTLKQWEAHKCVDYQVASDTRVFACYDGTVSEVYKNYLEGTVVVVDHGNGLKTSYGSLDESVNVAVGDAVVKGQVIGNASTSANRESGIGSYLRFTTFDNEKKIDPAGYLTSSAK